MTIVTSEFSRAARIQINAAQLDSAQTNLPIVITDALASFPADLLDSNSGTSALDGGGDIRICTDLAGINQLPVHVVSCVVSASAGSRNFVVLTNLPTADNLTEFYIFWGKAGATQPAATDPFGKQAVYAGWEFVSIDLSEDHTGNYGAFTVNGASLTTGPWGNPNGAYLFDGVNDNMSVNVGSRLPLDGITGNAFVTIMGWLDCQATTTFQRAFQISQIDAGNFQFGTNANDSGSFYTSGINTAGVKRPNKIPMSPNTGWHFCQTNVQYSVDGAGETTDARQWVDTTFGQGTEGSISAGHGSNITSIYMGSRNSNNQWYTGKAAGLWFHKSSHSDDFYTAMGRNQQQQATWAAVVETYNLSTPITNNTLVIDPTVSTSIEINNCFFDGFDAPVIDINPSGSITVDINMRNNRVLYTAGDTEAVTIRNVSDDSTTNVLLNNLCVINSNAANTDTNGLVSISGTNTNVNMVNAVTYSAAATQPCIGGTASKQSVYANDATGTVQDTSLATYFNNDWLINNDGIAALKFKGFNFTDICPTLYASTSSINMLQFGNLSILDIAYSPDGLTLVPVEIQYDSTTVWQ